MSNASPDIQALAATVRGLLPEGGKADAALAALVARCEELERGVQKAWGFEKKMLKRATKSEFRLAEVERDRNAWMRISDDAERRAEVAEARADKLEAALREIAAKEATDSGAVFRPDMYAIARAALADGTEGT